MKQAATLSALRLQPPMPLAMTVAEELALIRQQASRGPLAPLVRARFAELLFQADNFDEIIRLLSPVDAHRPLGLSCLLGRSLLNLQQPEATAEAKSVFEQAIEIALDDRHRSMVLAELAKIHIRKGHIDGARNALSQALALNPRNMDASKRLAALEFGENNPQAVLDHVYQSARSGVSHTRMLSNEMVALAALDRHDEARAIVGLDWSLDISQPEPPSSWAGAMDYHVALAREIETHPGRQLDRFGTASRLTWRVDNPVLNRSRATCHFTAMVQRQMTRYISRIAGRDHPLVRNCPSACQLRFWAVMTDCNGWEDWHMHQGGWLSGVYYPQAPPLTDEVSDLAGCLELGINPTFVGDRISDRFGRMIVRPRTGLMAIFPSYSHHRTHAHRKSGNRICIAFDIVPL